MPDASPCTACGACCATYRVSFYWAEAEPLPAALTRPLGRWYACMAGTEQPRPRCEALHGAIGGSVACTVYAQRPSPCRELQPGEDKCQRARRRHGLPPLGIDVGIEPGAETVPLAAAGGEPPLPVDTGRRGADPSTDTIAGIAPPTPITPAAPPPRGQEPPALPR